jgi:hypothetical protein
MATQILGRERCTLPSRVGPNIVHLKKHVAVGDMVESSLIHRFQSIFKRRSFVHQSLMSPSRRNDGSHSGKRESAFFEQWLHEQSEESSMSRQLFESWGIQDETVREVAIMASLIQWLGTNVGFAFLESALKRCGYRIERITRHESDPVKS